MKVLPLVILLMFLVVLAGGAMLENATVTKYFDRSRSDFQERETMKEILDAVVNSFDDLVALDSDDEQNPILENIIGKYTKYNLTIRDISSGCNLNFLPDVVLAEPALANFIFAGGNVEGFLRFRRIHGFTTDISNWKPYLKEESLGAVVCYGWLSVIHGDSETGRMAAASFGQSGESLYPLMNEMPLINVNTMDPNLLVPLLSCRSWRIKGVETKASSLKSQLERGPITERELRSLLGLEENHEAYRFLGARTAFWGISFNKDHYRMDAVIAAVPGRKTRTIDHYILIEGRISRAS